MPDIPALTGKNADWMSGFTDSSTLTLADISFPASHDAGLTFAEGGYTAYSTPQSLFTKKDTICQYYNIQGQLETGSRAFDLRLGKNYGSTRCFHGETALGIVDSQSHGPPVLKTMDPLATRLR